MMRNHTKLNNKKQALTRIEAAINTALILMLLTVIGYTVACSI